jgi:hypothetical protein
MLVLYRFSADSTRGHVRPVTLRPVDDHDSQQPPSSRLIVDLRELAFMDSIGRGSSRRSTATPRTRADAALPI